MVENLCLRWLHRYVGHADPGIAGTSTPSLPIISSHLFPPVHPWQPSFSQTSPPHPKTAGAHARNQIQLSATRPHSSSRSPPPRVLSQEDEYSQRSRPVSMTRVQRELGI